MPLPLDLPQARFLIENKIQMKQIKGMLERSHLPLVSQTLRGDDIRLYMWAGWRNASCRRESIRVVIVVAGRSQGRSDQRRVLRTSEKWAHGRLWNRIIQHWSSTTKAVT